MTDCHIYIPVLLWFRPPKGVIYPHREYFTGPPLPLSDEYSHANLEFTSSLSSRVNISIVAECLMIGGEDNSARCWFNVGPASQTLAQHWTNIGSNYHVIREIYCRAKQFATPISKYSTGRGCANPPRAEACHLKNLPVKRARFMTWWR